MMDQDPNGTIPDDYLEEIREIPLEVTRKNGSSNRVLSTYGSFSSLATVTHKYETEDLSDSEVIEDAFDSLDLPRPQYKKLFNYDGSWRDVSGEEDYKFVRWLELVVGDDGYVLEPRFDPR